MAADTDGPDRLDAGYGWNLYLPTVQKWAIRSTSASAMIAAAKAGKSACFDRFLMMTAARANSIFHEILPSMFGVKYLSG